MGQCVADSTLLPDLANDQPPQYRSFAQAIERNLAAYWLRLGMNPKGEVFSSSDIRWEYSGSPLLNRVVESHLRQDNVDSTIEQIKRTFRQRGAAVTWLVGPGGSPENLGTRLVHHGFSRYDDWIGMALPLEKFDSAPQAPSGLVVAEVDMDSRRDDWVSVVGRSFRFPRSARRRLRQALDCDTKLGADSRCEMQHLLAYDEGEPVSACSLFIKDGVAGIYLVSTIPEQRGNGLGSYMTCVALDRARRLGCKLAVLQSTTQARSMYDAIGFSSCCFIGVYRYDVPGPLVKRIARRALRVGRRLRSTVRNVRRSQAHTPREDVVTGERPAPSHAH